MAKLSRPRRGSLQYWPRKRANSILPSANWNAISQENNDKKILGFIGYKVGMISVFAKDNTPDSMTKGKRISMPATIIECPPVKILSVRFYKYNKVMTEIISPNLDKELIKMIKIPKKTSSKKIDDIKDYDDLRILVYSIVKKTSLKKAPDISEIGLGGNLQEKLNFVKENLNKEIRINDFATKMTSVDIHGVTKGRGLQGAVKRFGIGLKSHKSEKGRRRAGSLGPWHPARVTFHAPQAGQVGMFTRVGYNNKVLDVESISQKNVNPSSGFKHYGNIKTDYIVLRGSVHGPVKRQLLLTQTLRKTKKQEKKNFEVIDYR